MCQKHIRWFKDEVKNGQNDPVNMFGESAEVNLFIVLWYGDVYQIHYSMTETKPYIQPLRHTLPNATAKRRCFVASKIFIKSS